MLVLTAVFFVVAAAAGSSVFSKLSTGGFEDPTTESRRAAALLEERLGDTSPNLVVLVTADDGARVDDPGVAAMGTELTRILSTHEDVVNAASYWSLGGAAPLASRDGTEAIVLATVTGDEDQREELVASISEELRAVPGPAEVRVGGMTEVYREIGEQIESDLALAEMITFPVILVLLIFVFGSLVASSLPLGIGIVSIAGTFLTLWVIASVTQVSVFSINLTTGLGLGLAVDYSLFVVSRFREELGRGRTPHDAVVRTIDTAGRTVVFSAATVAISLAALLIFPISFLRSFAYAGIPVVAISAITSVVSLGAALAILGPRVDAVPILRKRSRSPGASGSGMWHRIAMAVMKRPVVTGGAVIALLVFLGLPFLRIAIATADDRVLPETAESRQVHDTLRTDFDANEAGAIQVAIEADTATPGFDAAISTYASTLSRIPSVSRVDSPAGIYVSGMRVVAPGPLTEHLTAGGAAEVRVVMSVDPQSEEAEAVLATVRDSAAPGAALAAGATAEVVDIRASLFSRLPLALTLIALVTFVVLFLMTGSVLVPAKALVMNVLSLSATFGAMVWIFQDGHLSGLFGFTPSGSLDLTTPILMFCIAFGLSMDYEVFLLSRIKEEYDRTGDNTASVAAGLEKTGKIVTAAAALLAIVFIAFTSSSVSFIQLFGLGLALAVIVDATLVRGVLVPAFMRLAGRANWWAPAPLRRLHDRFGLHEGPTDDDDGTVIDVGGGDAAASRDEDTAPSETAPVP
ncbi:MAG: MMPL family transporter [Acidimicrobiia bacterium]|nr:MMPL family transporter [Acidimicrobiia bacterium]